MPGLNLDTVSATVDKIYEAAFDQEGWGGVVHALRDLFGGSRACIVRVGDGTSGAIASVFDPEFNSLAAEEAVLRDPLSVAYMGLPVGTAHYRSMIIDEKAFRKRDLWHDWFKPRDMHDGLTSKLQTSNDVTWFVDISRGVGQDAFGTADIDIMHKIVPHMLRASQISQRLERTLALASNSSRMSLGVLLVDGHQRLLQMNETAEALLSRSNSPLVLKGGAIDVAEPQDAQELRRLISGACSLRDGVTPGTGGALLVSSDRRHPGPMRLMLSVAPHVNTTYGLSVGRCAAIMITEIAGPASGELEAHIISLFNLTPAEARLAVALASGMSLKDASGSGGITHATARTYLGRVFAKTGAHRQSELISLLKDIEKLRRAN